MKPSHDRVAELALQLLVAHHSLPSAEFTAGAQAVTAAKQAYTLAQVYLGAIEELRPPPQLGGRPRPPPTSAPGGSR